MYVVKDQERKIFALLNNHDHDDDRKENNTSDALLQRFKFHVFILFLVFQFIYKYIIITRCSLLFSFSIIVLRCECEHFCVGYDNDDVKCVVLIIIICGVYTSIAIAGKVMLFF